MSSHGVPVFLPEPMLRYRCNLQGCCCGGWRIPVREGDLERVRAARPELAGEELAVELPRPPRTHDDGPTHKLYFKQVPGPGDRSVCRFLDAAGSCSLHAAGGVAVLPDVCVQFPSRAFFVSGRTELRFRLLCPSVLGPLLDSPDPVALACVLGEVEEIDLARRTAAGRPVAEVTLGERTLTPEQALALRHHALGALNERDRPASEVLASLGAGLAEVERSGAVGDFEPRTGYDEQGFVRELFASAERIRPERLAAELLAYRPFVAPGLRSIYPTGHQLFVGLEEWPTHLLERVLPAEEALRPYLLRCLWARYHAVFFSEGGPHDFDHAAVVQLYAVSTRLLAALTGVWEREPDLGLLQVAMGLAAFCLYNHEGRELARQGPLG